jgi:hypothetical protein
MKLVTSILWLFLDTKFVFFDLYALLKFKSDTYLPEEQGNVKLLTKESSQKAIHYYKAPEPSMKKGESFILY